MFCHGNIAKGRVRNEILSDCVTALEHWAPSLWSESTDSYLLGPHAACVLCIILCQCVLLPYFMHSPHVYPSLMGYLISSFFSPFDIYLRVPRERSECWWRGTGNWQDTAREKALLQGSAARGRRDSDSGQEALREKVEGVRVCVKLVMGWVGLLFFFYVEMHVEDSNSS